MKRKSPFLWTFHNIVAHPVSEIVWLSGRFCSLLRLARIADSLEQASLYIHDSTVPEERS